MTLNPKALLGGLLVGLLFAGGALAIAGEAPATSSSSAPLATPVPTDPADDLAPPVWAEPGTVRGQAAAQAQPQHHDPAAETDFTAETVPGAAIVDACRGPNPPTNRLHCAAIIAIAQGRLAPGAYSDRELREKVDE